MNKPPNKPEEQLHRNVRESLEVIRRKTNSIPKIAIILGSGLGSFAEALERPVTLCCQEIPHYPVSTVAGHEGDLVFGKMAGMDVLAMRGRVHFYEGYSMRQVTYPVHLMAELGVKSLIVTNAAGGVNPNFRPGDLMLITDQIDFTFKNPLVGIWKQQLGLDMSEPYDRRFIESAEQVALNLGMRIQRGVLFVTTGPTYETAAEVEMIRRLGGAAVTMSTAPEVIVAKQRGLRVLGLSCITNMTTGFAGRKLSHSEVVEVANRVVKEFTILIQNFLEKVEL